MFTYFVFFICVDDNTIYNKVRARIWWFFNQLITDGSVCFDSQKWKIFVNTIIICEYNNLYVFWNIYVSLSAIWRV